MFGLANGMAATLVCSLVTAVSYRLAVFGTKGMGELRTPNLDFHFTPTPSAPPTGRHAALPPEIIEHKGFNALLAELEAFAGAITGGPPYPIPPDQILHGVAVFEAIVRSAATGQPVKVARDLAHSERNEPCRSPCSIPKPANSQTRWSAASSARMSTS